jgi:hypothetical protein
MERLAIRFGFDPLDHYGRLTDLFEFPRDKREQLHKSQRVQQ